jgi:hypothetical protein
MNSAVAPQSADIPKLPLWNAIGLAYSTYLHNFADVLRISWLWLVVCAALVNIASMAQPSIAGYSVIVIMPTNREASPPMPTHWSMPIDVVLGDISGLVTLLASVSIAVAWHRRIILDEHPRFSVSNVATKSFWRFAGMALAISLTMVPALVFLILLALYADDYPDGMAGRVYAVLIPVVVILVFATSAAVILRLSFLLPARAVGDLELTFRQTWVNTRRNTWRLFWGTMVCMMMPLLFEDFVLLTLGGFHGEFQHEAFVYHTVVTIVILKLSYLLTLPIGIGFLSLAYRHFFGRA